jgi:ATP-dependent helicase/nuclease subunit A
MRAWVLYKLDHGIDHILVDEAQDTAPLQWAVVEAIADEFLAGRGARHAPRSIFVVGDEKQSIFSFQGAEPQAFGRMLGRFERRFARLGAPLGRPALRRSYRSAPAILAFVDAVFHGTGADGLTVTGGPVRHEAHRAEAYGRIDLWPLIEAEDPANPPEWWRPVDMIPPSDARERLAVLVAEHIAGLLREGWLAGRGEKPARRVRAGDILVLVAKRYPLAAAIVRRLKALGLPVAGADRLRLANEIAVQDLLALAKVACLPGDDLSLAALLRSPLCGLSEAELFDLAHGRTGGLWQALRASPRHGEVAAFLGDMARRADFQRPYEFLEHALVRHDGRRRLLARLGLEAEDAIDELLSQALLYETGEAPSLTGFVAWIEAGDIEVRREMEGGGDLVRVMTVHGAKGLEAPIVILPDTVSAARRGGPLLPTAPGGNKPELTLWPGAKADDDPVAGAARQAAEAREKAERKRLLYVALTRAEDWLILCGAGQKRRPADCWYDMLEAGMARCPGVTRHPSPTGAGELQRFESGLAPVPAVEAVPMPVAALPPLPSWLGPAPAEARRPRWSPSALTPSEPHGGAGMGRDTALGFGRAVHLLLERLADQPPASRPMLAGRLLSAGFAELGGAERRLALAEAERVLAMPEAAALFGPQALAEVAVVTPGPAGTRMTGRIDRLVLGADEALIVDIKTDRVPAASPEAVPAGYLAQLGAYAAAISAAWPGRAVATALLWTARPVLMRINPRLTQTAFRASLSAYAPGIIDSPGPPT